MKIHYFFNSNNTDNLYSLIINPSNSIFEPDNLIIQFNNKKIINYNNTFNISQFSLDSQNIIKSCIAQIYKDYNNNLIILHNR